MSLSARKKVAKHAHTTDEVKAARKYVCERPQQLGIPASEVIISATETATTYLSNMNLIQNYTVVLTKVGSEYQAVRKGLTVKYSGADASTVINAAINDSDCYSIWFDAFTFECATSLAFKNGLTVYLSTGSIIRASAAMDRLIDGRNCSKITIIGEGKIDGADKATQVVDLSWASGWTTDHTINDVTITGGKTVTDSCLLNITYNSEVNTDNIVLDGADSPSPQYCIILDKSDGQNTLGIKRLSRFSVAAIRQGGGELKVSGGAIVTGNDAASAVVIIKPNGQITETKFFGVWFEGVTYPLNTGIPIILIQEGTAEPRLLLLDNCFCLCDGKEVVKSTTTVNHLSNLVITGGTLSTSGYYSIDCNVLEHAVVKPWWHNAKVNVSKFAGSYELGLSGGTQNLIRNPSYEYGAWSNGNETITTEQAKFGSYSAKLAASGSTISSGSSNFVCIKGMKKFTVAAWMKITARTSGYFVTVIQCYDGSKIDLGARVVRTLTAVIDWTLATSLFAETDLPSGTVFIRCRFYWDTTPNGTGYVDGWQVVAGDSLPQFEDYSFPLVSSGPSAPADFLTGDVWFDTTNNQLKRWNGSAWKVIHFLSTHGATNPTSNMNAGDFFFNTTDNVLYRYNGTIWVASLRTVNSGVNLPAAGRFVGDTFYSTAYEQTFFWTGTVWTPLATIARQGTSFPAYKVGGDIFLRTDTEEFYQYDSATATWIKINLLTSQSMGQENLVPNSGFSEDRDNDNIPDHWQISNQKGNGAATLDTTDPDYGGKSLKLSASAGSANGIAVAAKNMILTQGNTKYFVSYRCKGSGINPILAIDWYQKDGTTQISTDVVSAAVSGTWTTYSAEKTSPNLARFATLYFQVWEPASTTTHYLDDIIFSRTRAAVATIGVVAATITPVSLTEINVSLGVWANMGSFNVPAVDHELYIVRVKIRRKTYGTNLRGYTKIKVDSVFYPFEYGSGLIGAEMWGYLPGDYPIGEVTIFLPFNCSGKTIEVWFYQGAVASDYYYASIEAYGHSPHTHVG